MSKTNTEAVEAAYKQFLNRLEPGFAGCDMYFIFDAGYRAALSPTAKTEPSAAGVEAIFNKAKDELGDPNERKHPADRQAAKAAHEMLTYLEKRITALSAPTREREWQPIETAPKDGTVIWAAIHPDLFPTIRPEREDLRYWNGVQICLRHTGILDDGFDMGWNVAAPVGNGGFPDEWIVGWQPLPEPPRIDNLLNEGSGQ